MDIYVTCSINVFELLCYCIVANIIIRWVDYMSELIFCAKFIGIMRERAL